MSMANYLSSAFLYSMQFPIFTIGHVNITMVEYGKLNSLLHPNKLLLHKTAVNSRHSSFKSILLHFLSSMAKGKSELDLPECLPRMVTQEKLLGFFSLQLCHLTEKKIVGGRFASCFIYQKPYCFEILKSLSSPKTNKQFCTEFT